MSKLLHINSRIMPYATWMLRILIGGTFILSGLSKMIDVWGFAYKIEQYFNVWGWQSTLQTNVIIGITISAIEFVVGLVLSTGCYKRSATWIAASIMAVMLPLSAYIMIANPVDDCGCFGDLIKISNTTTFLKNIFICIGITYLLFFNHKVKGLFHHYTHWLIGCIGYIYILSIGLLGYNIQPLVDFRQYKVGTSLIDLPSEESSEESIFIYSKDGVTQEYSINNLPDSTWTFVDRIDSPTTHDATNNISIYDSENNDVTTDVITTSSKQILVLIPSLKHADISYSFLINEMYNYSQANNIDFIGIFANNDSKYIKKWRDLSLAQWPIYTAEKTTLTEIARGKISVIYLNNGIVQWKRTLSSIPSDIFSNPKEGIFDSLNFDSVSHFKYLTLSFISLLILILIFNSLFIAVIRYFSRKKEKKNVTLQNENSN